MDCEPGDVTKNMEKAVGFLRKAKEKGAELVLLPELFNVGYDFSVYKTMTYDFEETKKILSDTAKELNIHIVAGILEKKEEWWYNSLLVFDNLGEILTNYCKINLFPLSYEEEIFIPGKKIALFTMNGVRFGLMICFDIRFPELSRQYYKEKCDVMLVSSAFPFPRLDHWRTLLKSRAIENQMYVIAANRSGKDSGVTFLGNSCVIDPWGTVKATANETEETVIIHEITSENVNLVRNVMPVKDNFKRLNILFK